MKVATTWLFRIEQLVAILVGGVANDADLAAWLRDLPEDAHRKLSHVGLVCAPTTPIPLLGPEWAR